ncbi:MAG: hypothetical protein ABIQ39_01650, partial [Ilumatobacteraceae bacterium]
MNTSDDDLSRLLADALERTEPVPADAVDAAYAAIEMADLNDELAALVFDSSVGADSATMRSADVDVRLLSFVNDHLTLDIELHHDGQTIVGQVTPADVQQVEIQSFDATTTQVVVDHFGRFRALV